MIGIGWYPETHHEITRAVLSYFPFSQSVKKEILRGEDIPDTLQPVNFLSHYRTPHAGNAVNQIVKNFNSGRPIDLGKSIHYLQDISNPFHTSFKNEELHKWYERFAKSVPLNFTPQSPVLLGDLRTSTNNLALEVHGYFEEVCNSWYANNYLHLTEITSYLKTLAAQATYDLIQMWVNEPQTQGYVLQFEPGWEPRRRKRRRVLTRRWL